MQRAKFVAETALAAVLLCVSLASCVVEPAQPAVVHTAPPPPRAEVVPGPRPGYIWAAGHWRWAQGAYVWEPGHWEAVRVGYHWVPGHWAARGPGWVWVEGHWAP
ncbi:YXWGXW repeat-containing protein [Paraburkholderia sp.]|uniref:YXWGXW repeat-containing protein n=1 Tax=Paraburkholderia sp. TaxID=1926495 RepID=UPI0039E532A0